MVKLQATTKQSLTSRAYESIHTAICNGSLPAGCLLSENDLSRQLNMSRTPIREALRILESQDFVEIRDGLGTFVKTLSDWEIRDLYQIRGSLEPLAASTAIYHIKKQDIDALEAEFNALLARHANGEQIDFQEFSQVDAKLHQLISDNCQNKYVCRFMASIMDNIQRCQVLSATFLDDLEESTKQHLVLLQCIRDKDQAALEVKMKEHLAWSLSCLSPFLKR